MCGSNLPSCLWNDAGRWEGPTDGTIGRQRQKEEPGVSSEGAPGLDLQCTTARIKEPFSRNLKAFGRYTVSRLHLLPCHVQNAVLGARNAKLQNLTLQEPQEPVWLIQPQVPARVAAPAGYTRTLVVGPSLLCKGSPEAMRSSP